ncbi:hypothetical protein MANES_05G049250v8 [Manihot esculenta]|uniref:Uncharacterized protein n=1 Tax=Manihot esculenta TaxID=3983 RepID=A0ACB7HM08_MANES|nr:hypothetical protein MANES_05G049250v8 [Manihot esculenta]
MIELAHHCQKEKSPPAKVRYQREGIITANNKTHGTEARVPNRVAMWANIRILLQLTKLSFYSALGSLVFNCAYQEANKVIDCLANLAVGCITRFHALPISFSVNS